MCDSSNPRILFVVDDFDSSEMIDLMLHIANNNYEVTVFSDPLKALVLLENQPIALLILDYVRPEMTGIELCRQARQTDSQIPILVFSPIESDIDKENALKAGATEYLVRPNDPERFTETVRRLLDESRPIPNGESSNSNQIYTSIN